METIITKPLENCSITELSIGLGSLLLMNMGSILAHEYAHFLAMRNLFSNINPFVSCTWNLWGIDCSARYNGIPTIPSESLVSYEVARGLVSAAGPVSDLASTALSSIIAWKMQRSNQKVALLFATHAFMVSVHMLYYSLASEFPGHDFAKIEKFLGIPRYIQSAICFSAVAVSWTLTKRIRENLSFLGKSSANISVEISKKDSFKIPRTSK